MIIFFCVMLWLSVCLIVVDGVVLCVVGCCVWLCVVCVVV